MQCNYLIKVTSKTHGIHTWSKSMLHVNGEAHNSSHNKEFQALKPWIRDTITGSSNYTSLRKLQQRGHKYSHSELAIYAKYST